MGKGILVQIGGRRRFLVAEALEELGLLDELLCDFCVPLRCAQLIERMPFIGTTLRQRLANRVIPSHLSARIQCCCVNSLIMRSCLSGHSRKSGIMGDLGLGEAVQGRLRSRRYRKASFIYSYDKASAVALQFASDYGIRGILDQTIAPNDDMESALSQESTEYGIPYVGFDQHELAHIMEEQKRSWALADTIVCGSKFVEASLRRRNVTVPIHAIRPLVRDSAFNARRRVRKYDGSRPLRVLTVGQLSIRKGTHVSMEAARPLDNFIEWRFVGHPQADFAPLVRKRPSCAILRGFRRGHRLLEDLDWADVFVLPSLWEGSAYAVTEATYLGLPAIVTFSTGGWVRDGVDGFVLDTASSRILTQRLQTFLDRPGQVCEMSVAAIESSQSYGWNDYKRALSKALCPTNGPVVLPA